NFTILPNSLGSPALPLRMTSVDGLNRLRSLPSLRVLPRKMRGLVCLITLSDERHHLIELRPQPLQCQLFYDARRPLHAFSVPPRSAWPAHPRGSSYSTTGDSAASICRD